MTKVKQTRWQCPNGCAGVLGPTRPRKDNVCRYCLPCSAKAGKLVERTAPALEAKRQTSAQKAAEKAKAKRARAKAIAEAKWTVDGVDMVRALALAIKLPSAKPFRGRAPEFKLRRSKTATYVSGVAYCGQRRFVVTCGPGHTAGQVIGVMLHELAHLACYAAGEQYGDKDRAFANRCHELHDEWNKRHGKIAIVDDRASGAYRGSIGRARHQKTLYAALPTPVAKPTHKITTDNAYGAHWWKLADELHPDGVEVAIPGVLANELECRCADTTEDGSDDWRHRFVEVWDEGTVKRAGKGTQRIIKLGPGELTSVLREAIDWAVWDYADEPTAMRQAAQVLSRLINTKEA
jgi:hypothetical protein